MVMIKRFLALFFVGIILLAPFADAQTETVSPQLDVSPLTTSISAIKGDKKVIPITVTNSTDQALEVTAQIKDFRGNEKGEALLLPDGETSEYSATKYLSGASTFTLEPLGFYTYDLLLTLPDTIDSASLYSAVVFSTKGSTASIGSLIFINVGEIRPIVSIKSLTVTQSNRDLGTATVVVDIKNESDFLAEPLPNIAVKDINDTIVKTFSEDNDGKILPKSSRKYTFYPTGLTRDDSLNYIVLAGAVSGADLVTSQEVDLFEDELKQTADTDKSVEKTQTNSRTTYIIMGIFSIIVLFSFIFMIIKKHRHKVGGAIDSNIITPQQDPSEQENDTNDPTKPPKNP